MRLVQTLRLSAAVAGCSWCNDMPGSGRLAERDLLALASSVAAEAGGLDAGPSRFYKALRALASRRAGGATTDGPEAAIQCVRPASGRLPRL